MASTPTLILRNPMRYLVPIGTALLTLVMFIPPIVFAGVSGAKVIAGTTILGLCILWMIRSAFVAPFEMSLTEDDFALRRGTGTRHYQRSQIRKWWFAVPDGAPTQVAPATNGVLYIVLNDRTRFRAEVTKDEAETVARLFKADQSSSS